MARDTLKTMRSSPLLIWIAIGLLAAVVVGLMATYVLRPGRSPADDARTAAAISAMDVAQTRADERREEKRGEAALLN